MRSARASGRRGPPAARRILPSDDDDDCIVLTDSPVNNTNNRAGPSRPSAGASGSGREFMSSTAAAAAERRAARRRPRTIFSSDDEDDTENQPPARRGRSTGHDQHDVKMIQEEADAALARRLQEEEEREVEHLIESTLTADEIAAILGESPEPVRTDGGRWQGDRGGRGEHHRHGHESSDSEDDSFDDVMAARVDTDDDEDILDLTGVGGLLNGSNVTSTPGSIGMPRRRRRLLHGPANPAIQAGRVDNAVARRLGGGEQRPVVVNVARRGRGGVGGARVGGGGRMLPGGYHGADGESDADTDEMEEDMDPANNEYLLDSFLVEGSDDEILLRRDSEEEEDEDEEEDSDDYDDPDDEEAAVRRGAPYAVVNGVRFVLGYGDRSTHRLLPGDVLERVRGCVPIKSRGRITGYKVGVATADGSIPREMVVDAPGPSGSGATTARGRRPRGEVGRQRRSSLPPMGNWGECTICFDKEMEDPVGCELCRQLVGCRKCVNTWFSMCGTVGSASVHAHRSCPLCRQSWGPSAPKVERMDVLARNTSSR